jgi:hypothetical protein
VPSIGKAVCPGKAAHGRVRCRRDTVACFARHASAATGVDAPGHNAGDKQEREETLASQVDLLQRTAEARGYDLLSGNVFISEILHAS